MSTSANILIGDIELFLVVNDFMLNLDGETWNAAHFTVNQTQRQHVTQTRKC